MWSGIKVVTPPAIEPVTVQELKENLRLDGDFQTSMLESLIKSARISVETKLHRTLIETEYIQLHQNFEKELELYRPPAISISEIQYESDSGLVTIDPAEYILDKYSTPAKVIPVNYWPTIATSAKANAVQITFKAGYGQETTDVPEPIRQAIIMLASDMYEHPEANVELKLYENTTLRFLLASFELPQFGE